MAPLDQIPPDQRAVLQLVLGQGQRYDEIAGLLGIEPSAVRDRAHAAADALAPDARGITRADSDLIADYLLGQTGADAGQAALDLLTHEPGARAWARALAGELRPMARDELPEIPEGGSGTAAPPPAAPAPASREQAPGEPARAATRTQVSRGRSTGGSPRSSRLGGALLLGGIAAVAAVVLLLVLSGGDDNGAKSGSTSTSTQTGTATTQPQVEAQINLTNGAAGGKAKGIAQVLRQQGQRALAIVGQDIKANSRDAYAVWLYNSRSDAQLLGFIPQEVGSDGRLSGIAPLPDTAERFRQLIVTRETIQQPRSPGAILLRGRLRLSGA